MVGKTGSGRRPGFKHSEETKAKISKTKKKQSFTEEHRENITQAKLDAQCAYRLADLRANYPDQQEFFDDNEAELLFAMQDVRTEGELRALRKYIESEPLHSEVRYRCFSSSCYAAEDTVIALIDLKRELFVPKTPPIPQPF